MLAKSDDGIGGEHFYRQLADEEDISKTMNLFLNRKRGETVPDQWQSQILIRILMKAKVIYVSEMSDEEKKAKELKELLDGKASLEAEVAQLKLEKECVSNGFSAEETEKLINGNFSVKDIADIIKARCDEAVKSAKAEATKSSTAGTLLGKGSTGGDAKSDFQKHQESKVQKSTVVELK